MVLGARAAEVFTACNTCVLALPCVHRHLLCALPFLLCNRVFLAGDMPAPFGLCPTIGQKLEIKDSDAHHQNILQTRSAWSQIQ